MLTRHIHRQRRHVGLPDIRLDRAVYLERERVTDVRQWLPWRPDDAAGQGQPVPQQAQNLGEHTFEPLALQVGQVMIQLVGQRSQRPRLGSSDLDLADQVTGQLGRHGADRYPQEAHSWLPRLI